MSVVEAERQVEGDPFGAEHPTVRPSEVAPGSGDLEAALGQDTSKSIEEVIRSAFRKCRVKIDELADAEKSSSTADLGAFTCIATEFERVARLVKEQAGQPMFLLCDFRGEAGETVLHW